MSLYAKLSERAAQGKPLVVGLIGAGKFGAMYLAQVLKTPGVHLAAIADLAPANAKANLARVGWKPERYGAASLDAALAHGTTHVSDDWEALVRHPRLDVVVECTGHPLAAVEHCLAAFRHGKHVVNVTVEADALCGPLLARRATEAGVSTASPTAISRRLSAIWSTGGARPALASSRRGAATSGCRILRSRRRTRCGAITG